MGFRVPYYEDPNEKRAWAAERAAGSWLDTVGASFDIGREMGMGAEAGWIHRKYEEEAAAAARGDEKFTAEELNRIFVDEPLENPFDEPMSLSVARLIVDRQRQRHRLGRLMAAHPAPVSSFIAAALGTMTDPGELAYTAGAVVTAPLLLGGMARLASGARLLAKIAKIPKYARFIGGASLANVPAETITAWGEKEARFNYTASDFFMGTTGGVVLFGGMGAAWKHVVWPGMEFVGGKGMRLVRRIGPQRLEELHETAEKQFLADKKVNVDPIVEAHIRETVARPTFGPPLRPPGDPAHVPPVPLFGQPSYQFTPLSPRRVHPQRTFFVTTRTAREMPKKAVREMLKKAPRVKAAQYLRGGIEENYGHVIHGTDSAPAVNVDALHVGGQRRVQEVRLVKPVNLLDLDKPLGKSTKDKRVITAFRIPLQRVMGAKRAEQALQTWTVEGLFEELRSGIGRALTPEDSLDALNLKLSKRGWDGYRKVGGRFMGIEGARYNKIFLFTEDALEAGRSFAPSRKADKAGYRIEERRLNDILRHQLKVQSNELYNERVPDDMALVPYIEKKAMIPVGDGKAKKKPEDIDANDIVSANELQAQRIVALGKQMVPDKQDLADIKEIADLKKAAEVDRNIRETAIICMGRGL